MKILHTDKLDDVARYICDNNYSEFILNSDNVVGIDDGVSYSVKFDNIKTHNFPSAIMLSNSSAICTLAGIKDVSFENNILGELMNVLMKTGKHVSIICR